MGKAWLSILGLYQYDNSLFDDMSLPEGVEKELVIDGIIQDCMELELLFPDLEAMRQMIKIWSRREMPTWQRVYNAEHLEYNPIENYDRFQTDNRNVKHSGKDVSTSSGESTTDSLHKYASFDSNTLNDQSQDIDNSEATNTGSLEHGENIADDFTSRIHGNIGVTTSQQMLESEMELAPKINTVNYIINSFKMRFCILVY